MANKKTHLVTVPSFIFDQISDDIFETSIQVAFYRGTIELSQNGNAIILDNKFVRKFFNEILRHQPEAEKYINKQKV